MNRATRYTNLGSIRERQPRLLPAHMLLASSSLKFQGKRNGKKKNQNFVLSHQETESGLRKSKLSSSHSTQWDEFSYFGIFEGPTVLRMSLEFRYLKTASKTFREHFYWYFWEKHRREAFSSYFYFRSFLEWFDFSCGRITARRLFSSATVKEMFIQHKFTVNRSS